MLINKCLELSFQSLQESEICDLSDDNLKVRSKLDPEKWPIEAPPVVTSTLHADVPEFVPGKAYTFVPHDTGIFAKKIYKFSVNNKNFAIVLILLYSLMCN